MNETLWMDFFLSDEIAEAIPHSMKPSAVHQLPFQPLTEDATQKFIFVDERGSPIAFALCATEASSLQVARAVARSEAAIQALEPAAARHIARSVHSGVFKGCSFAIYPYCNSLSNKRGIGRIQNRILAPRVLRWLSNVTNQTKRQVENQNQEFRLSLQFINERPELGDEVRLQAERGIERLTRNEWTPYFCLMHGDLWKPNVLVQSPGLTGRVSLKNFVVIDWAGATLDGYAIYDLVRLAHSTNLSDKGLLRECRKHAMILDCHLTDTKSYLLAAIGHVGRNREHLQYDRWLRTVEGCSERLDQAVGDVA